MITRTLNLLRSNPINCTRQLQPIRQKWYYRDQERPQDDWKYKLKGDILAGFMWFCIMWHMITEWDHFVGEYVPPDPTLWTDEELGIPPDTTD